MSSLAVDPNRYMKIMKEHIMENYLYYLIFTTFVVTLSIIWYVKYQINKGENNNARMESEYENSKYTPRISNIDVNDARFKYNTKKGIGRMVDYYIASSFNSCCSGDFQDDYVSLVPLKEVIYRGARLLDFEIYSVDDDLVVGASGSKSPFLKGTYNSLPLGGSNGVFAFIKNHAFSTGSCPNPRDPLFIHLRIKTNIDHYDKLSEYVKNAFGPQLLDATYGYEGRQEHEDGGKNLTMEPLSNFTGSDSSLAKVIIICDHPNKNYRGTSFEELINLSSDSAYLREFRSKEIFNTHFTESLEMTNRNSLALVMPDISSINDNYSPQNAFSYGCQLVCMNYQKLDSNMQFYFKKFNDAGTAFVLKPDNLRFTVPLTVKTPPKQHKELSYAPKKIDLPMYKTTI